MFESIYLKQTNIVHIISKILKYRELMFSFFSRLNADTSKESTAMLDCSD